MRRGVIHEILFDAAWHHGNKEIVSGDVRLTYAESWERVVKAARALRRMGIRRGEVLGILDVNSHQAFELQYAASLLGAIAHPLNFRLPLHHLVHTVRQGQDRILFAGRALRPTAEALRPHVCHIVWLGTADASDSTDSHADFHYEDLLSGEEATSTPDPGVTDADPYSLLHTTGTTGRPKAMRYRHRDIVQAPLQIAHHLAVHETGAKLTADDVVMPLIPFFHIHAWGTPIFAPYLGLKLVLPGKATPAEQIRLVQSEGVTWSNMVPTQLLMLLDAMRNEGENALRLKVLTGGSQLPMGLASRAYEAGVRYSVIYGGSDQLCAAMTVSAHVPGSRENLEALSSRLAPIPMVRMSIRGQDGGALPADGHSVGELWVESPWLPDGYVDDEAATQQAYVDGWFRTGDLAVAHPDCTFSVVDRVKDAVKSGGEWIIPSVIESVISEIHGVRMAAMIGRPDERWGERPVAILAADEQLDASAVEAHLAKAVEDGRLARFWLPDAIHIVQDLPLTSAGKVDKVALRAMFAPT
ncbi:AMP-binding protein [Alicyclobacillus acidocaldarius]|uniref:AMP-dependent synthetase and ligase n=1 Tax=Alicyclobacillus acidocaldarius (strain Tc-4-1) TaxID=1048834 RepID=F8IDN4_ALIAT|nr:AMP-binding protein [Alicyclobacillus acidocaldarius]AEJ45077.1 AMP-dependent synthetase and ligase [Alicyclobacillus acidocaldarius subsp. acidocaldarius Tc-4-1]